MRQSISQLVFAAMLNAALCIPAISQQHEVTADMVKAEFLHAWSGYKQYAWGHDALKPLSKQPHDWYGTTLLMTPVDAYDVMLHGSTSDSEEMEITGHLQLHYQ